jgi:hypothetical protein
MDLEALLLRAIAPAHLADPIIGDLYERHAALAQTLGEARALAVCRAEALRSLPSLAAYRAWQALADNWIVALPAAAIICASCVIAIPFWDHVGMGGGWYHLLRLFVIGLILGCIPRASTLSVAFLLLLIGISNSVIDARELNAGWRVLVDSSLYRGLSIDAAAMAAALTALRVAISCQVLAKRGRAA